MPESDRPTGELPTGELPGSEPPAPATVPGARPRRAAASALNLSRRQFLVGAAGAGAAGALGLALARHGRGGPPPSAGSAVAPGSAASAPPGILVLLTLYGGNDGLNTLIPYQDGTYLGGRAQLGYQPEEVIPLADGLALHPNLKRFKQLWDAQHLAIVRGVGYPNPNRSHFRSMDIWQSAAPDSNELTGWLGRWLDGTAAQPMQAIAVGSALPRALFGSQAAAAVVPVGPLTFPGGPSIAAGFADLSAVTPGAGALAARAAQVGADLVDVADTVAELLASQPANPGAGQAGLDGASAAPTGGARYGGGDLASQLDVVGRLIKARAPSAVYSVSLGGFDTHVNEKDTHARLWAQVDTAVSAFLADMAGDPHGEKVVVMAYSEFGRRVAANASGGTDHGTAAPVFVAGAGVKGGFYGDEPSLSDLDAGDLRFTTDFRSVYASVLGPVLGVDPKQALGKAFPTLPFL